MFRIENGEGMKKSAEISQLAALCNKLFAAFLGLGLVAAIGCGADVKPPEPGTCRPNVSSDCQAGFRCNGTRCEDIYHPRQEIKNY
jgi:hypothetical protein